MDFADIQSVKQLRNVLYDELREGRVVWCRLGGLSATADRGHGALLHMLADLGLGGEQAKREPHTAVLDWSAVTQCSADGFAFFSVTVRALRDTGMQIVLCEPADGDIMRVVVDSGIREACDDLVWIPCQRSRPSRMKLLGPAALFDGPEQRDQVGATLRALEDGLDEIGVDEERIGLISSTARDLVHNVLSHAGQAHAALVAVLHTRRRPPLIEIGIADGGVGIAAHLLAQARHGWLQTFTDATVTTAVFDGNLSGRSAEAGGGGLSQLIQHLREKYAATVVVRSGTGVLTLAGPTTRTRVPTNHPYGWGTQTRIEIRLEG